MNSKIRLFSNKKYCTHSIGLKVLDSRIRYHIRNNFCLIHIFNTHIYIYILGLKVAYYPLHIK